MRFFTLSRFASIPRLTLAVGALSLAGLPPLRCLAQPSTPADSSAEPAAAAAPPNAADPEAAQIAILQSNANARQKDGACQELKHIGTTRCIPALAALLTDAKLSHSARYVLESMTAPEASAALLGALPQTKGEIAAGIIDSLGVRREARAVPALATALRSPEPVVAIAAVNALGEIATPDAIAAVQAFAKVPTPAPVHQAAVEGLLRCADQLRMSRQPDKALPLYETLHAPEQAEAIRVAGFRGVLQCSGERAAQLAAEAIAGPAGSDQLVALQLVHELPGPGVTATLATLLPRLDPPRQVAVINGLSQRNDPAAAPAIAALARSPAGDVRVAALTALGKIGDASHAVFLAETAAATAGAEQSAARDALVMLRRGQTADALLAQLPTAKPAVQAEIARALAARTERSAVPKLQALARQDSDSAHAAVLALARLGEQDASALGALVQLVVEARDESSRSFAAVALNSAYQHIQYNHGRADVGALVNALDQAPVEARVDLVPCCSRINDPEIRRALRASVTDSTPAVREAATTALCATRDAELLPDLVNLACSASADVRSSAVAACVRLAKDDSVKLTDAGRLDAFRRILDATPDADQKRSVAAALAAVPELEALQLLTPLLDDAAVRDEAAESVLKIAPLVADRGAVSAALQKIAAGTQDSSRRERASRLLGQSESGFGFITAWQVSGPFEQVGREYAELLEYQFKLEAGDQTGVKWKPLAGAETARKPWLVDLRSEMGQGKDNAAAYARTWVHADAAQPVQLEIGSDSGMKIWVNQKVVHANSALRPLHAGADTAAANLKPGWNSILVKLAQPGGEGEFCLRLVDPAGTALRGLQIDATTPHDD